MNKLRNLISIIVLICTISTVSYAKGTVTGKGTPDDPFKLVLGEGIIDIYYGKNKKENESEESYIPFYFKFESGNVNAANYIVDHNADKHRVRFTLVGSTDDDRAVVASVGRNYIQAGAIAVMPDSTAIYENKGKVEGLQIPFYKITATETFLNVTDKSNSKKNLQHEVDLANGKIRVNNTLAANVSTYATSFVFCKSGLDYSTAYTLVEEQITKGAKMSFSGKGTHSRLTSANEVLIIIGDRVEKYTLSGPVDVIYCFQGTNSNTQDAEGEASSFVEKIVSKILIALGDAVIDLTGLGGDQGKDENGVSKGSTMYVTIDAIVFNEYPKVIVDFWGDTQYTSAIAKNVINFWFKVFKAWAIVTYIILLSYMGIKAVIYTGTPEQKKIKQMLEGWVVGVLMLFFLPYLFKYMITINDAMVDVVRVNSKYSAYAYYTFADEYKLLGGLEQGEDSTTDIVTRLLNAKGELEERLSIEEYVLEDRVKDYDEAQKDLQEFGTGEAGKKILENIKQQENQIEGLLDLVTITKVVDDELVEIGTSEIRADLNNILSSIYTEEYIANEIAKIENEFTDDWYYTPDIPKELKNKIEDYMFDNSLSMYNNSATDVTPNLKKYILRPYAEYLSQIYSFKIYAAGKKKAAENCESQRQDAEDQVKYVEAALKKVEENDVDLTGMMRARAGATSRFIYVFVWLLLVFQVILLLVLYYKRLFMLTVLISIFPLVTVAYVYEKSQGTKGTVLKNWFAEFTVNVFIQTIHAILYVVLVEVGYTVFIANNDSWILFVMAVFALLTVEPVFKQLLGLRGSTVQDLGNYGKAALGVAGAGLAVAGTFAHTAKDLNNIHKDSINKEAKEKEKNKEKDKKRDTKRKEEENRIRERYTNSITGEMSDKGKRLMEEKKQREEAKDKKTAEKRKRKLRRMKREARARMVGRVVANTASAAATVAGGFAAGGDVGDFVASAKIANSITGTNGNVKYTDEGKKLVKDKDKEANKKLDEAREARQTKRQARLEAKGKAIPKPVQKFDGPGQDNYSIDNGNAIDPKLDKRTSPRLHNAFKEKLSQQKEFSEKIDKKLNIFEENK